MARKTPSRKAVGSLKAVKRKADPSDAIEPGVYTVFISHSSKEKWIARQIAREIEALGAATWLDIKDLRGGDEMRRSVKRGIRSCDEVVVLLSSHSTVSQWVSFEVGVAYAYRNRITLVLNDADPNSFAPMQDVKAINLNDFDDLLVELAARIAARDSTA
jgi:hypothetical protein